MNSATQCIVLLACVTICFSASILNCQCVNTVKHVNKTLIAGVTEYKPRPYCNKQEVIVLLKDNTSRCLDLDSDFTKALLKIKAARAEMKTTRAKASRTKASRTKSTSATPTASTAMTSL